MLRKGVAAVPHLGRGEIGKMAPKFQRNPFSLGVASGDPDHESVVLWTRLSPEPLLPNWGMPHHAIELDCAVAVDEGCWHEVVHGSWR